MRFREHGVGKAVMQLKDRAALVAFLKEQFAPWPDLDHIKVDRLKAERIGDFNGTAGWKGKVYMVIVPEYGVVGYTDEPL